MNCIESTYAQLNKYGHRQKYCNKVKRAIPHHRLVWQEHYGEIPKGLIVRHKCDNPKCINIEHLELGTRKDNAHDRTIRQRYATKFTVEDIEYIRSAKGKVKQRVLAEQYNVHVTTIQRIQYKSSHKHI
jgi:hypothetical protein